MLCFSKVFANVLPVVLLFPSKRFSPVGLAFWDSPVGRPTRLSLEADLLRPQTATQVSFEGTFEPSDKTAAGLTLGRGLRETLSQRHQLTCSQAPDSQESQIMITCWF